MQDSHYLGLLWVANTCPCCGVSIPEGTRVGTGRKVDGGFCSMTCYLAYYSLEIAERTQRARKLARLRLASARIGTIIQ